MDVWLSSARKVAKVSWTDCGYNALCGDIAMPIHDWFRVPSGLLHDFHQSWSIRIKDALNSGRLPKGVAALVEQRAGPKESDVLAIEVRPIRHLGEELDRGIATLPPPVTRIVRRTTNEIYASRANRIVVKHHLGRIIAVIEIVSPGNKDSRAALRDFVEKTVDCLRKGIHVLIVDLFRQLSVIRLEFIRSSGTRSSRKTSRFPTGRTVFWSHTRPATSALPTSSR